MAVVFFKNSLLGKIQAQPKAYREPQTQSSTGTTSSKGAMGIPFWARAKRVRELARGLRES